MSRTVMIRLTSIRIDGGTQSRADADDGVMAEYAEAYLRGDPMPPIYIVDDGQDKWLVDGFHRRGGAIRAGLELIDCIIVKGTLEEARWMALAANKTHGLRRTNGDKRHAVRMALEQRPDLSNRAIAEHVGVDEGLVRKVKLPPNEYADNPQTNEVENTLDRLDSSERAKRQERLERVHPEAFEGDHPVVDPDIPEPDFVTEILDDGGDPIPQQCRAVFLQRDRIAAFLAAIDELRREIKDFAGTVAGAYMFLNSVETNLTQARFAVSKARPARVCPKCKAEKADCRTCKGHGWVNEDIYKTFVSQEKS